MIRSRRSIRPVVRMASLLTIAVAALAGTSGAAGAATAGSAAPQVSGQAASPAPQTVTQTAPQTVTQPDPFSCDFSGYGGPPATPGGTGTGTGTSTGSATLTAPRTATAGDAANETFAVPAVPIPSSAVQALASVSDYQLDVVGVTASDPSGSSLTVVTHPDVRPAATPGEIPAMTDRPLVWFQHAGTGHITGPVSFTITPFANDGTALPVITCSSRTAEVSSFAVTVTAPPPPPSASGADYFCQEFLGTGLFASGSVQIPMTISVTGHRSVGHTDQVTLTSTSDEFGSAWPHAELVSFAGTIPVTGADSGVIALRPQGDSVVANPFVAVGSLHLSRPGTVEVRLPTQFSLDYALEGPPGQDTASRHCTLLTRPDPVAVTLTVTAPAATPPPGTGHGGGTAAHGAVPAGAPRTGGGPRPGYDLPLAAGGAALLLTGGSAFGLAVRRRHRAPASTGPASTGPSGP